MGTMASNRSHIVFAGGSEVILQSNGSGTYDLLQGDLAQR